MAAAKTSTITKFKKAVKSFIPYGIVYIVKRRNARKKKDWKRSDELRDALKEAGYIVEDTKNGQKVRKNV